MDASSVREPRSKLDIVWAPVWKSRSIVYVYFFQIQADGRNFTLGASNAIAGTVRTTYTVRHGVYALDAPRLMICPYTDDDGEKETRVLEEYIKAEDAGSSDEERKRDDGERGRGRMRVGDRIEAKYRGRSKYYKGKISRVRADGTC